MLSITLRIKILFSIILTTALFGIGMVVFAKTIIYSKLSNILLEQTVYIAKKMALDCVNPVITEQYFKVTIMLKDVITSEEELVYGYVLSNSGSEIAHTFEKGVPASLIGVNNVKSDQAFSVKKLATDKGGVYDIAVPLLNGDIGVLHLGLSDKMLKSDVNEIVTIIILYALTLLLIGVILSIIFSQAITRPLRSLSKAVEAYGRGEKTESFPVDSKDEIGELALVCNIMLQRRKAADDDLEKTVRELREALDRIKKLSGLLPICASCKKIRDDKGYWNQIESYIKTHSDAEFSHGICPECAVKLYPELVDKHGNFLG
ncbi:HAMP domain-containing protein [Desulfogranum japonicum]|uniref:HAMP domain-containing protein n=1 Tax=Desulfogranum japonicum TaxID=231447 RepID=UPI0003FC3E34|nr:HAMP domain-containing protein [Desulfogranum japonicum]